MKFKVEVDVEDFDLSESDFTSQFKTAILWEVKNQIMTLWKEEARKIFFAKIEERINESLQGAINELASDLMNKNEFFNGYGKDKVTLRDAVIHHFNQTGSYDAPEKFIKKVSENIMKEQVAKADAIAKELRARHDLSFATQIVKALNEQKLLKDGVIDTLLKKDSNEIPVSEGV
jgi:hypothetical protein